MSGLSLLYAGEAAKKGDWAAIPDRDRTGRLRKLYWAIRAGSDSGPKQFVNPNLTVRPDRSMMGRARDDPGDGFTCLINTVPRVEDWFEWPGVTEAFTAAPASQIESPIRYTASLLTPPVMRRCRAHRRSHELHPRVEVFTGTGASGADRHPNAAKRVMSCRRRADSANQGEREVDYASIGQSAGRCTGRASAFHSDKRPPSSSDRPRELDRCIDARSRC